MAEFFDTLSGDHVDFICRQPVFFVATAAKGARINLSPKGMDVFRVLTPNQMGYLDVGGSGNETQAHLAADGRVTVMFCAFDQPALIMRLYGRGSAVLPQDAEWAALAKNFTILPGARQIFLIDVDSVQTSCGWGVPVNELRARAANPISLSRRAGPDRTPPKDCRAYPKHRRPAATGANEHPAGELTTAAPRRSKRCRRTPPSHLRPNARSNLIIVIQIAVGYVTIRALPSRSAGPLKDVLEMQTQQRIVMVVEDEALIRLDAMMMLEDAGFAVVDASDADAALVVLEARSDVDALFTDVNMPGKLDGVALAHRARELNPTIRIVVTSGARRVDEAILPTGSHFVPKPYVCSQVAALLAA